MGLFATINRYLTDELLGQLAAASALPPAAGRATAAAAVPALVRQLAAPTDLDELNARWDMCRQLYLSQLLTEPAELLRTDMGWPDRRRYLSQKMLGSKQVAALAEAAGQPAQAGTLLGYLTIVVLALVGEHASHAGLTPEQLGSWLAAQQAPTVVPAAPARPEAPAPPPTHPAASAGKAKMAALSVGGTVVVAGLVGAYLLLSPATSATPPAAAPAPAAEVAEAAPAPAAQPAAPTPEATAAPAPAAEAPAAAMPALAATPAKPVAKAAAAALASAGLRDTVGNAGMARQVGGKFNVATGRYPKGESQPLIIKLVNRATLTVGINSTESLLYKRLAHPSLPRPADIAVDRLSFDLGQARLGAEGAQQLGSIASLLKTFPKARLVVVGHANNHEAQAMRLGLQRANLAVDELVKQGIAADRLQAQGMLSTELPGDNDSAEKQASLQGITLKISRLSN
ncbi:MAG TPA: OmpA family protein [Hymenobacter sp.]|uniref:OmpA family protein n=1 Tax=Hymenobacter sp. TaxID=1898978 RepID=UPI002D80E9F8|nr:OmpA family protein [Hymenobacter sp.]HET9504492.1 OmpA family protein [Hymenobacter sp.]